MNYDEFKRQLGKAGLSIKEFADLLQISCNSVSNYSAKGLVPAHFAVTATLMGEMADKKIDFRTPIANLELSTRKPRTPKSLTGFGRNKQYSIQLLDHEN